MFNTLDVFDTDYTLSPAEQEEMDAAMADFAEAHGEWVAQTYSDPSNG